MCLVKTASSICSTAYASLGYVGLRPRSGYAPFGIGATRGKFARIHSLPVLSSLALSTCVVYSPNGLRFARLCRPSASIRIYTFWRRRLSGGKFARSRRSDLDAPFALKTRSCFRPTPPRQDPWLRTKVSPTAPSLPLLTRENPPLRAFHCQTYA